MPDDPSDPVEAPSASASRQSPFFRGLLMVLAWGLIGYVLHVLRPETPLWICAIAAAGVILFIWPGPKSARGKRTRA